jgi:hypothetical protein
MSEPSDLFVRDGKYSVKAIKVELNDFRRRGHTFGLGAGEPSAPRKPNDQGRNGADGYSLQQTSAGLSLQD